MSKTAVKSMGLKKGSKARFVTVDYSGATRLDVYQVLKSKEGRDQLRGMEELIKGRVRGFANLSQQVPRKKAD